MVSFVPSFIMFLLAFVALFCWCFSWLSLPSFVSALFGLCSLGEVIFPIEGQVELDCREHVSNVKTPILTQKTQTCTSKNPID